MDTELYLTTASRESLVVFIAHLLTTITQQKAVIARLQRRVGALEWRINSRRPPGMPGNKPSSRPRPPRRETRKGRDHGFARVRMTSTQRVEHAVEFCPDCGAHLAEGWVQRSREVVEIPVSAVKVIEHVLIAWACWVCRRRHVPKVALQGAVMGQQRLGVNLVSLIVTLREAGLAAPAGPVSFYVDLGVDGADFRPYRQLLLGAAGSSPGPDFRRDYG